MCEDREEDVEGEAGVFGAVIQPPLPARTSLAAATWLASRSVMVKCLRSFHFSVNGVESSDVNLISHKCLAVQ